MHIKSILAAAAIALAATVGSASAADQFATLDGVTVQPMNAVELDQIRGNGITLEIPTDLELMVISFDLIGEAVSGATFGAATELTVPIVSGGMDPGNGCTE